MPQVQPPPPVNQADQAALCKSTNTVPGLYEQINKCSNPQEQGQRASFITSTTDPKSDFDLLTANYNNLILSGDSMLGTMPDDTTLSQIKMRNTELKDRLDSLHESIKKKSAIVERTDRDFVDVKDQHSEVMRSRTVHVIEDYTLVVLSVSFLLLACTLMFLYINANNYSFQSIIMSVLYAFVGGVTLLILVKNFL